MSPKARVLGMAGLEVEAGLVGDPDPVAAVDDALPTREFDEVVVATLPRGISRWLRLSLPHRLRRMTDLPVTHVTAHPHRTRRSLPTGQPDQSLINRRRYRRRPARHRRRREGSVRSGAVPGRSRVVSRPVVRRAPSAAALQAPVRSTIAGGACDGARRGGALPSWPPREQARRRRRSAARRGRSAGWRGGWPRPRPRPRRGCRVGRGRTSERRWGPSR